MKYVVIYRESLLIAVLFIANFAHHGFLCFHSLVNHGILSLHIAVSLEVMFNKAKGQLCPKSTSGVIFNEVM